MISGGRPNEILVMANDKAKEDVAFGYRRLLVEARQDIVSRRDDSVAYSDLREPRGLRRAQNFARAKQE